MRCLLHGFVKNLIVSISLHLLTEKAFAHETTNKKTAAAVFLYNPTC
jgi:hypothetical protein